MHSTLRKRPGDDEQPKSLKRGRKVRPLVDRLKFSKMRAYVTSIQEDWLEVEFNHSTQQRIKTEIHNSKKFKDLRGILGDSCPGRIEIANMIDENGDKIDNPTANKYQINNTILCEGFHVDMFGFVAITSAINYTRHLQKVFTKKTIGIARPRFTQQPEETSAQQDRERKKPPQMDYWGTIITPLFNEKNDCQAYYHINQIPEDQNVKIGDIVEVSFIETDPEHPNIRNKLSSRFGFFVKKISLLSSSDIRALRSFNQSGSDSPNQFIEKSIQFQQALLNNELVEEEENALNQKTNVTIKWLDTTQKQVTFTADWPTPSTDDQEANFIPRSQCNVKLSFINYGLEYPAKIETVIPAADSISIQGRMDGQVFQELKIKGIVTEAQPQTVTIRPTNDIISHKTLLRMLRRIPQQLISSDPKDRALLEVYFGLKNPKPLPEVNPTFDLKCPGLPEFQANEDQKFVAQIISDHPDNSVLSVEGPAGCGKTAMLAAILDKLTREETSPPEQQTPPQEQDDDMLDPHMLLEKPLSETHSTNNPMYLVTSESNLALDHVGNRILDIIKADPTSKLRAIRIYAASREDEQKTACRQLSWNVLAEHPPPERKFDECREMAETAHKTFDTIANTDWKTLMLDSNKNPDFEGLETALWNNHEEKKKEAKEKIRESQMAFFRAYKPNVILCTLGNLADTRLDAKDGLHPKFEGVFIDEAAACLESRVITTLTTIQKGKRGFICLIGDRHQLPPVIQSLGRAAAELETSALERLEDDCHIPKIRLTTWYRQNPFLSTFPNILSYNGQMNNGVKAEDREYGAKCFPFPNPKMPFLWLHVKGTDTPVNNSRHNELETEIIERVFMILLRHGAAVETLAIMCAYGAQKLKLQVKISKGILILTIDGFQGSEREIILMTTVRSNIFPTWQENLDLTLNVGSEEINRLTGFMRQKRRLNVALTRARSAFLIIGDVFTFMRIPGWKELIQWLHKKSLVIQDTTAFLKEIETTMEMKSHLQITRISPKHNEHNLDQAPNSTVTEGNLELHPNKQTEKESKKGSKGKKKPTKTHSRTTRTNKPDPTEMELSSLDNPEVANIFRSVFNDLEQLNKAGPSQ